MNELINNPIFIGLCCGIISILFNYLDSKIIKKKKSKKDYIKILIVTTISVSIVIFSFNIIKKSSIRKINETVKPVKLETGIADF
tara:strand:- start:902 stop:1156 length:255 start_codon:yes stop_codon:yes gene_type:complete